MRKLTLNNRFKLLLTGSLIVVLLINVLVAQTAQQKAEVLVINSTNINKMTEKYGSDASRSPDISNETVTGTFIFKWSVGFDSWDLAFNSTGYIYITDNMGHHVQIFALNGTFVGEWGSSGSGDGQFSYPAGIAINSSGYVYVVDYGNDRVQVFDCNGNFVSKWGQTGSEDGNFSIPQGIAINASGYVYVVDRLNDRVQVFDCNGNFVSKWGQTGSEDGNFSTPVAITINGSGYVYTTEWGNDRIQVFDCNGNFITKWGSPGSDDGQFDRSYGIAVDTSGYVYATDCYNHRVQVFTSTGTFMGKWGRLGNADGEFNYPVGIAINSTGYIYVSEDPGANQRAQVFLLTPAIELSATAGNNQVSLTWIVSNHSRRSEIIGYQAYRSSSSDGPYTALGNTTVTAFLDTTATNGQTYYYVVRGLYSYGVSDYWAEVSTTPNFPQLSVGVQNLIADNQTINVTFFAEDHDGSALADVLLEISNSTDAWAENTATNGQYNLTLDYTPNEFTLEVNASKSGYIPDNETFVIYIDPPAVDYTPPVDELDPSALATFGMFALIFVAPWIALTGKQWQQRRKKKVR